MRTPEQISRYKATAKAKRDARAIAAGRVPGAQGNPNRLTAEQREESRKRHNQKTSVRSRARLKSLRAAKAIAEDRIPGRNGTKPLSDEERVMRRKATFAKFRAKPEFKARDAECKRRIRAEKAIAEGRVPGVIGHLSTFSAEELASYLAVWRGDDRKFILQIKTQNYRAKKLSIQGEITVADVLEIYHEQKGCCAFCGSPFDEPKPEIDHWYPLSRGGMNDKDNIKILHRRCNRTKGAKLPQELSLPLAA